MEVKSRQEMDPGIITKLDEAVVNRIAAGEIIQRPANALKEMIENSLDAKASLIEITIKTGGLKLLQIKDNGTGIRRNDLEIVCERFTTSKLEKFEDLTSISTFGFRGEALSSISHVAHLTVQTKTNNDQCAYKATYEDGKLKGTTKPCAGNQGTIITVEDLFFNVPQRKQALKAANEEYQKIFDVVSKYAIHNSAVGFVLKKSGENITVRTNPKSSQIDNIRTIYGNAIAKELISVELEDDVHQFKLSGFMTNVNYSARKNTILLFINHRLVESAGIKTAVDSVYATYMPKGSYPFVYLSLQINPNNVDVNVHPTKHEVHFLHEDDIIVKIKEILESKLLGSNSTRSFYKQSRLPGASDIKNNLLKDEMSTSSDRINPKDVIRTDSKEQKLDKFFSSPTMMKIKSEQDPESEENVTLIARQASSLLLKKKQTKLSSILSLRKKIESNCSPHLRRTLKDMTFVGVVNKDFGLFQFETKLYLCSTFYFSHDLFYQILLYEFENFNSMKIDPALSVYDLAMIALDTEESGWTEEDGPKDELAMRICEILSDKSRMLREYFGLDISDNGMLCSLPLLLEKHKPSLCLLPMYILRLATEVNWDSEIECFQTFCHETADFYSTIPEIENGSKHHKWMMEYVIYPSYKEFLIPSTKLKTRLFELTNLPNLYKVFERC